MSSSRFAPGVYTHSARPEWGRAVVAQEHSDRTTYVFENAGERTVMNEPSRVELVELPVEEREALAKSLLKSRSGSGSAPKKKRAPSKAKKKKAAPAEG